MITEDYVSYETAKLLKEKGFREWCSHCYGVDVRYKGNPIDEDEEFELKSEGKEDEIEYVDGGRLYNSMWDNSDESKIYAAPTLAIAIKWIREIHNIQIEISVVGEENKEHEVIKWMYGWRIQNTTTITRHQTTFTSYQESCENAIKYCLQNLIN